MDYLVEADADVCWSGDYPYNIVMSKVNCMCLKYAVLKGQTQVTPPACVSSHPCMDILFQMQLILKEHAYRHAQELTLNPKP